MGFSDFDPMVAFQRVIMSMRPFSGKTGRRACRWQKPGVILVMVEPANLPDLNGFVEMQL
jgi:hypothetical protein